jgi:glycosyltransferase involved in cell wall biosynthesis
MLMGAIARKLGESKPKLLFDIRGFMPEEYVDAGIWSADGLLYRGAKRIERWLMRNADGFVVLTEAARKILFAESKESGYDKFERPVEVIPCCVDLSRSNGNDAETRTRMRQRLAIGDRKVLAYVGSFGGWYLSDEMMDLFSSAREKDSDVFVMILTQRDVEKVAQRLAERGFQDSDYFVASVDPRQVSSYLTAADIAVSLIKPCYSKLSSSPTKLAEYLVCGLPIISNRGVGDVDNLIEDHHVGVLLDGLSKTDYLKALEQIEKFRPTKEHCVNVGQSEFDLGGVAGNRYRRLYERMTDRAGKDH